LSLGSLANRRLGSVSLWPIVVGLVAAYALGLKVFAVDRLLSSRSQATSRLWFVGLSALSVAFALVAPEWLK
jgi:hypothetical protein